MLPPTATVRDNTVIDARFQRLVQDDPLLSRARAWPLLSEAGDLVGILTQGDVLRALDRGSHGGQTALEAGTPAPTVAHPEELLEEAMNAMIVRGVKQLPVVNRREPRRLLGIVDGAAIATAWSSLREDEHVREAGHLMAQLRLFRRRMRKVRRGPAPGDEAGDAAA
jgi:CBS-domain-containing membrane protein